MAVPPVPVRPTKGMGMSSGLYCGRMYPNIKKDNKNNCFLQVSRMELEQSCAAIIFQKTGYVMSGNRIVLALFRSILKNKTV